MFDKPFRNHPLMIIDSLGSTFYFLLSLLIIKMPEIIRYIKEGPSQKSFHESLGEIGIILLLTVIALLAFYGFRGWRIYLKRTYQLTPQTLIITDQRLHHSALTLYRKDISNVTLSQSILQRLLGLYRIKIDTNTRDTANITDVSIIQKADFAHALQKELQRDVHSSNTADSADNPETPEHATETDLLPQSAWQKSSVSDVIMHVCMNLSWFSLFISGLIFMWALIAFILIFFIGSSLSWTPFSEDDLDSAWTALIPLIGFLTPLLSSTFGTYFKCHDFRIRRIGEHIELQQGLITRHSYNLPVEKIHAVVLEQRIIARLFGYASVKAVNVGFGNEKNEEAQLLLTTPLRKIGPTLDALLPEFADLPIMTPQPRQAVLPILAPRLLTAFLVILPALYYLPGHWKWLIAPLIAFFPLYIYAACITPHLALSPERIAFTSGVFDSTTLLLPTRHIEQIEISEPLLARPVGLSKATVHILSGSLLDSVYSSGYFPKQVWTPLVDKMTHLPTNEIAAEETTTSTPS